MANQPLVLQLDEGRPAFLDVFFRNRPVDLVEVNRCDAEPGKAPFDFAPERVALEALDGRSPRPLGLPALCEHERALGKARKRATDDLFRVSEAVLRGRVDPVDAELERMVNRCDRVLVVLRAPAPVVACASERPGAEADAADLEAGAP